MQANPEAFRAEADDTMRVMVCTHGKVDPCCAVLGDALFRAVDAGACELWHGAHFGGYRFAGDLWCLTSGNCYGHVDTTTVAALLAWERAGRVFHTGFRGRIGISMVRSAPST